jgi:hypothetical protein
MTDPNQAEYLAALSGMRSIESKQAAVKRGGANALAPRNAIVVARSET